MSERTKLSHKSNVNKEVLLEVPTEQVEMTLNTESKLAMQLIMQRLTALYDNPIEASVRETVSNGLDALEESHSGVRPELKIFTPSNLHPVLIVEDNGIGMSYEDLKNVYAKYGASTKGDNLNQVGAYGLGAKSPLAYGNEFTVTSVKGNERTTIIVAREEMTNYIKIVETGKTTEPSGTTVSIPISTNDISQFTKEVYKYKNTPMDKDVDLYIDDKLVKYEGFSLLTDKLLIHTGKENTYGRVWIDNSEIVKLMTNLGTKSSIEEQVRLVIGGWSYKTPYTRKELRYSNDSASLYVELKPGIVDFNSSRDVIQDDEKSDMLVNNVVDYVSSPTYTQDLIKLINALELSEFKKVASSLLSNQLGNVSIIDRKGQFVSGNSGYRAIVRPFYFEDMTHVETGYNLNKILSSAPIADKYSIILSEKKYSHKKTAENRVMLEANSGIIGSTFRTRNISDINEHIEYTFLHRQRSNRMSDFITKLATIMNEDMSLVTFVTNVKRENVQFIKSNRKAIYQVAAKDLIVDDSESYLVYTEYGKKEIVKMVEEAGFNGTAVRVSVYTVNEMDSEVKELRKLRESVRVKVPEGLTTKLYLLDDENTRLLNADTSELSDKYTNLIIISKDKVNSPIELSMIKKWYVNDTKIDKDTVKVYLSVGFHKVSDLKIIDNLGVVMRGTRDEQVGRSSVYFDDFHGKVAQMNALYNDSEEVVEQAFIRTLSGITRLGPKRVHKLLNNLLEEAVSASAYVGYDLKATSNDIEAMCDSYSKSIERTMDYHSARWELDTASMRHLSQYLNKSELELIVDLATVLTSDRYFIKGGIVEFGGSINLPRINLYEIKASSENEAGTKYYNKLIIAQTKSYLSYVNGLFNRLSNINK